MACVAPAALYTAAPVIAAIIVYVQSWFYPSQVTALVAGDEMSALREPTGYRGEFTIAYRSTKVRYR
jgi:hypothetical protein